MAAKIDYETKLRHSHPVYTPASGGFRLRLEVCMGMGKTGIPWVPWDSHGNGSKISHGMGMGWERELSAWECELRRGNWQKNAAYCRLHCN